MPGIARKPQKIPWFVASRCAEISRGLETLRPEASKSLSFSHNCGWSPKPFSPHLSRNRETLGLSGLTFTLGPRGLQTSRIHDAPLLRYTGTQICSFWPDEIRPFQDKPDHTKSACHPSVFQTHACRLRTTSTCRSRTTASCGGTTRSRSRRPAYSTCSISRSTNRRVRSSSGPGATTGPW